MLLLIFLSVTVILRIIRQSRVTGVSDVPTMSRVT